MTWWERLGQALRSLAAVSGVVSFAAFSWQTYRDVSVSRANLIKASLESEVFGIVFECREFGAMFVPIRDELKVRILRLEPHLGPWLADFVPSWIWRLNRLEVDEVVSNESVRLALMLLGERGIVKLKPNFAYILPAFETETEPTVVMAGGLSPAWLPAHCNIPSGN